MSKTGKSGQTQKYDEGSLFTVPIEGGQRCFLGLVLRKPRQGALPVVVAQFYGPLAPNTVESWCERIDVIHPKLTLKVGDRLLKSGKWKLVGRIEGWDRKNWPVPRFLKTDLVSGEAYLVEIDEENPGESRSIVRAPGDYPRDAPRDVLTGPEAAELQLEHLGKTPAPR